MTCTGSTGKGGTPRLPAERARRAAWRRQGLHGVSPPRKEHSSGKVEGREPGTPDCGQRGKGAGEGLTG